MVLRALAARGALSLAMFVLTAALVCGCVVAVGFSSATSVSRGSAGALVLLGLVGLAGLAVESVRRRAPDVALARLRGHGGARLGAETLAEPAVVVVCGAAAGVALGWVVGRASVGAWLPRGATFTLSTAEWVAAGAVAAAALVVVGAAAWRLLRTPLHEQLSPAHRPASLGTWNLFLQLLLVLGAAVALYESRQSSADRADWIPLVSPAVVGLAAAQLLLWLSGALLAAALGPSRTAAIPWFLSVRRLLRRADALALVRVVVAAGVVIGVAVSASSAAAGWRSERARLQVGAPTSYPVTGGALRAYVAAHRADPAGRWLLPVAAYTSTSSPGERRVFVDAARWTSVVGDFFAGTPEAALADAARRLEPASPVRFPSGRSASVTVTSASLRLAHHVAVQVQYADDAGNLGVVNIPLRAGSGVPAGPGRLRFTARLGGCSLACTPVELDASGYTDGELRLTEVTLAGQPLLAAGSGYAVQTGRLQFTRVRRVGTGLAISMRKAPYFLGNGSGRVVGTFRAFPPLPAVATPTAAFERSDGRPAVADVDGYLRPVRVVAQEPALPFVGTNGTLLDLGTALRGAGGTIPTTETFVLARADTPRSVVAALERVGGIGRPVTYGAALHRLSQTSRAQGTRLYLVVGGFAALLALVSLAAALAFQRPDRRVEAAGLRSVGVPAATVAAAYRREALLLSVLTFVGTWAACWLSCKALLATLPLVSGWAFAPPLDASPPLSLVTLVAAGAAVAVALLAYVALRRTATSAAPRLLREDLG